MEIRRAECALVAFSDGEFAYLTRRFDGQPGGLRVQQEDLLQIKGLHPGRKYDLTYEQAGQDIDATTNGNRVVSQDLFRQVLLSYLIGNSDHHMKNLGLQKTRSNKNPFFGYLTANSDVLFADAHK
jgi:serine/threonine-protein kinase HipA